MKVSKILLAAMLVICMAFCLFACEKAPADESKPESAVESSEESVETSNEASGEASDAASAPVSDETSKEEKTFTVTVVDNEGNAVSGVMVQLCKEACIPRMSDANGVAVFNVEITDGFKLSVMSCPAGYTYEGEAEVYLEEGATEYTLTLTKAA